MAAAKLNVPDISCERCERTVKSALSAVDGVQGVQVDISSKTVRVQYDPSTVDVEQMKDVLAEEDYPVAAVERQ